MPSQFAFPLRLLLATAACAAPAQAGDPGDWRVAGKLDIAPVWSGHPVGFDLLTHGGRQFAAYYDAGRRMTVAHRPLDSDRWDYTVLPSTLGWDSHNYLTMTLDDDGFLHLCGNMHCVPLIYFRSSKPLDPSSFERIPTMTGQRENKCTYPRFFRGPANELIFTYRDGSSGNGDQLYNTYDHRTKSWRRMLDQPLTSGEGRMNAYLNGPIPGPDGWWHICWVWRDHGGCETNHDLSYARSKDLVNWTDSSGKPLELPMTIGTCEIIDPVPAGGGMINGNNRIGFDNQHRVVVSYHKFDQDGNTQACNARLEDGKWRIYQVSDWGYRWDFNGGGSINFEVAVGNVSAIGNSELSQSFSNAKHGSGVWRLDEETMKPLGLIKQKSTTPAAVGKLESTFPGMRVKTCGDSGDGRPDPSTRHLLRWETLPQNRDRPREGELPPPSMLRLYQLHRD